MSAPTQIAHYKITGKLGEGGMGAVYRATDTKLNREVAIKILPGALDADRVARFAREAQVLAALNHPNIATIYGVEDRAIIMELVDGQPLKGPVSEDTALSLITQLIDALEYAHDKTIIHRDLKPANIMVTADGRVKVLDFGLAKALAGERVGTGNPETSPTLTMRATEVGLIMGTASYMAPEQARGATVDKRADIWSFGVVLYELLTGKQLFGGDNVSDILADVLKQEIDFSPVPARFRKLVALCLTRDPKLRMRDVSAARHFLDGDVEKVVAKPSRLPWAVAAGALLLAVGATAAWLWPRPAPLGVGSVRFQIPLPEDTNLSTASAMATAVPSPDGKHIVLVLSDKQGTSHLWLRALGSTQMRKLERTQNAYAPFWSPDSQSIAYYTADKLMRVAIASGTVQSICSYESGSAGANNPGSGGAWSEDGQIVFALARGPLLRVPAEGGVSTPLSKMQSDEVGHLFPQFLPGGKQILFFVPRSKAGERTIEILDVATGARVVLTKNETKAVWTPPGILIFARDGVILAQKLRLSPPALEGEPVTIAEGVLENTVGGGRSSFMVSPAGVLAYRRSGRSDRGQAAVLVWYDRQGKRGDLFLKDGDPSDPVFSPDGKTVAMYHSTPDNHLWIADAVTGVATQLKTAAPVITFDFPVWSPDSKRIIVTTKGIREIDVGSGKESEFVSGEYHAHSLAPDGSSLLATIDRTLFKVPSGSGSQPSRIAESPDPRGDYRLSPDGRWVAYLAGSGRQNELFIASFPAFDQRQKITSEAAAPLWSRSGKEIYYWNDAGAVYSAGVKTAPQLVVDRPVELFRAPNRRTRSGFAVTADGQRFLIPEVPSAQAGREPDSIQVIVNWQADLPK